MPIMNETHIFRTETESRYSCVCTCMNPKRTTASAGEKKHQSEKMRKRTKMLNQKLHTKSKSSCAVSKVRGKGQGRTRLGRKLDAYQWSSHWLPREAASSQWQPEASLLELWLSNPWEQKSGLWDETETRSCHWGGKRSWWAFSHGANNQDLSSGMSCLFCLLQFTATLQMAEGNK